MTKLKLKEISDITTGIVINRFKKIDGEYDYNSLNFKCIRNNQITPELFNTIKSKEKINTKYLLKKNDIIIKLTPPFNLILIKYNYENTIIPSSFAVIRVNHSTNPEYLTFYLKTNNVLKQLNSFIEGSALLKIRIEYLKNLEIEILEKRYEENYVHIMNLFLKKIQLEEKKLKLEKRIKKYYLNSLIN